MYSVCMTIENIEKTIRKKLSKAPQLNAKIKFDFGSEGVIHIDGSGESPVVSRDDKDADTTFVCSVCVFQDIVDGKQDPAMAFMMGKVKIQGSMGHAMKLGAILED